MKLSKIHNARGKERLTLGLGIAVFVLSFLPNLWAHDSPQHVADMLTARMKTVGRRPDLLWRRATEYRALGELRKAARDLRAAIRQKKDFTQALVDLSRVELALGANRSALRTITQAMKVARSTEPEPGLRMVQAEILAGCGRLSEAVAAGDRAIEASATKDPEWFLTRSQWLGQLGRYREAADGLRRGFDLTGNAVLEAEWIDASIDAGEGQAVLQQINERLEESRYRASWLIRRGRAQAGLGNISAAQADYLAAITELTNRLGNGRGDLTLVAERGLAFALIGDVDQARSDLAAARAQGAEPGLIARLERAIQP